MSEKSREIAAAPSGEERNYRRLRTVGTAILTGSVLVVGGYFFGKSGESDGSAKDGNANVATAQPSPEASIAPTVLPSPSAEVWTPEPLPVETAPHEVSSLAPYPSEQTATTEPTIGNFTFDTHGQRVTIPVFERPTTKSTEVAEIEDGSEVGVVCVEFKGEEAWRYKDTNSGSKEFSNNWVGVELPENPNPDGIDAYASVVYGRQDFIMKDKHAC